ncbi:MAG TPA: riboflavin synthase, partial [Candidatus Binataceae bacterium]|nr:riboflavin synthase [Candidatus Binataceae bacterium]
FLDYLRHLFPDGRTETVFTGIIKDLGEIERVAASRTGATITIRTALPTAKIIIGESIAVSGTCLTVTRKARGKISADVSPETLRRTTLGGLKPGDRVNLERCLTLGKLLGGHLVAGHVDGTGRIVSIKPEGESKLYTFEIAPSGARYLIEKGSIAIDGVSLTVFGIRGRIFSAALIPHTLKATTLGLKRPGDAVNFESDMMAKYVEKILAERDRGVAGRFRTAARGRARA